MTSNDVANRGGMMDSLSRRVFETKAEFAKSLESALHCEEKAQCRLVLAHSGLDSSKGILRFIEDPEPLESCFKHVQFGHTVIVVQFEQGCSPHAEIHYFQVKDVILELTTKHTHIAASY